MFGIVVATHVELGNSLIATLRMILGENPGMTSVTLEAEDSMETFQTKLEGALKKVDPDGLGTFFLVDMLGGTPFNVSIQLARTAKAKVITGVNLPMLITAVSHQGEPDFDSLAAKIQKATQESILTSDDLFKSGR